MLSRLSSERMGRCAVVLYVALSGFVATAAEPEGVRIDYVAPAGCPDSAAFLRALRERTSRFRQVSPGEQARRFSVQVTPSASSFSGQLEIRGLTGDVAVRRVIARSCEQVVSALALMTALAISPGALTDTPKPAGDVAPLSADAPPAQSPATPWQWSAGVLGRMVSQSPDLGYGGELFLETEAPVSSPRGPSLRAGAFFNRSSAAFTVPADANATLQWMGASLEGCPTRLGTGGMRLAFYPCLAFRLGALRAQGRGISQPKNAVSLWSDIGPLLRVRFAVTARLAIEAQGAFILPLTRPTLEIMDVVSGTPATEYSVARWGVSSAVGATYRFP